MANTGAGRRRYTAEERHDHRIGDVLKNRDKIKYDDDNGKDLTQENANLRKSGGHSGQSAEKALYSTPKFCSDMIMMKDMTKIMITITTLINVQYDET